MRLMRLLAGAIGVALLMTVLASWPMPAAAANVLGHHPDTGVPAHEAIVAVIDTGADGLHPEFGGYRGQAGNADPQIVAWWDFSAHLPTAGQTWDPDYPVPFDACPDGVCHGTGTASLVGGATVGAYPGVKLAIAKVGDAEGSLVNIEAAIEWSAKTVGADVLSMSFGSIIPVVGAIDSLDESVQEAWEAGALPVVAAGNGLGNVGVKYPSWTDSPSYSPFALVVGASGKGGNHGQRTVGAYYSNLDPEVLAWGSNVYMAYPGARYTESSGTSFSAPHVAGWAAKVMEAALANGQAATPGRVELLLEWTANDHPALPYAIEGFGLVDDGRASNNLYKTVQAAVAHAAAGTLPPAPSQANLLARDVTETLRYRISGTEGATLMRASSTSTAAFVGPSTPGVRDVDVWGIPLASGDAVDITVRWVEAAVGDQGVDDLDVFLFRAGAGVDGIYNEDDRVAGSAGSTVPGLNEETFSYRAVAAGTYPLFVEGWAVGPEGQAYELVVEVDGVEVAAAFAGDHLGVPARLF